MGRTGKHQQRAKKSNGKNRDGCGNCQRKIRKRYEGARVCGLKEHRGWGGMKFTPAKTATYLRCLIPQTFRRTRIILDDRQRAG